MKLNPDEEFKAAVVLKLRIRLGGSQSSVMIWEEDESQTIEEQMKLNFESLELTKRDEGRSQETKF